MGKLMMSHRSFLENLYLQQIVNISLKFFKFKRDEPKYKITEMLEEFRGEAEFGVSISTSGGSHALNHYGSFNNTATNYITL
jgi:hypothetical protein